MAEIANPVIQTFYQQNKNLTEQVYIPVTDGRLAYNVSCDLKAAAESNCKSIITDFQKTILLYTIDEAWERHLLAMDELQNAVRNVSYENKDP